MKNKKIVKLLLILITMIFMIISLTGCSSDKEVTSTNSSDDVQTVQEDEERNIVTTGDYTKWPSGVYEAYNIPEYTFGEVVFAQPYAENGSVSISTNITELRAYIYSLQAKGFKLNESTLKSLKEYNPNPENEYEMEETVGGTIFAPEEGAGYTISFSYREKPYKDLVPANSFETITEDYEYESNCSFSINVEEYPEENIEENLLADMGLSNEDILPQYKVFTAEKSSNDRATTIFMDTGYDIYHSKDEINEYKLKLVNAFEKASDDTKIYDYNGQNAIETEEDKKELKAFNYKYNGKNYIVLPEIGYGYGAGIIIRIENK